MNARRMIDLERWRFPSFRGNTRYQHITQSLPFVVSRLGRYVHRVRSATLLVSPYESHTSIRCWCGQNLISSARKNGSRAQLIAAPDDRPICATCEGRAIGAGLLGAREIAGRQVMFAPGRRA